MYFCLICARVNTFIVVVVDVLSLLFLTSFCPPVLFPGSTDRCYPGTGWNVQSQLQDRGEQNKI